MSKYKTVKGNNGKAANAGRAGGKGKTISEPINPAQVITGIWVALVFTLFPVIFSNGYFNILETKYATYCIITGSMIGALLIYGIASGKIAKGFVEGRADRKENGFKGWFNRTFDFADKCILLFYLISFISTFTAYPYIEQAATGVEGRYTGLILLTFYCVAYFCVTRNFKFKQKYVTLFLWFGIFICWFGITDYYKMDIMGLKARVSPKQVAIFTSTIGNINTYTTFVGFVIALAGTLFVETKETITRSAFYLFALVIAFMAMAMGNSDNGYLTLGAFFAFLPFVAFRRKQGIRRYFITMALFFTDILYINYVDDVKQGKVVGIQGLFNTIADWKHLIALVVLLWAVVLVLYLRDYFRRSNRKSVSRTAKLIWIVVAVILALYFISRAVSMNHYVALGQLGAMGIKKLGFAGSIGFFFTNVLKTWFRAYCLGLSVILILVLLFPLDVLIGDQDAPAPKAVGTVWKILVAAGFLVIIALVVKANQMTVEQANQTFGSLGHYLKFSDHWGTDRGIVWRLAMKDWTQLSPIHKIFGTGPDTFGIYMMHMSYDELLKATNQLYDSAHNEYLQYFFTIGPIGLAAYIAFLAATIRKAFRKADILAGVKVAQEKDRVDFTRIETKYAPYLTAFGFVIICYAAQATVNINLPISTPIMWAFLMVIGGMGRKGIPYRAAEGKEVFEKTVVESGTAEKTAQVKSQQ